MRRRYPLTPEQQSLTWGSHFVRFYGELVVFGHCYTKDEFVEEELRASANTTEFLEAFFQLRISHGNGYLYGRHYSIVEPEGELGSTHRVNAWPVSPEFWDAAKSRNWAVTQLPLVDQAWLLEIDAKISFIISPLQIGDRVTLTQVDAGNPFLHVNDQGTVVFIDKDGLIYVSWDSGHELTMVWEGDVFERIQFPSDNPS